jgi:hypothetical protein
MAKRTEIKRIPNSEVPRVKADFEASGATIVIVKDNGDGTSDVVVHYSGTHGTGDGPKD